MVARTSTAFPSPREPLRVPRHTPFALTPPLVPASLGLALAPEVYPLLVLVQMAGVQELLPAAAPVLLQALAQALAQVVLLVVLQVLAQVVPQVPLPVLPLVVPLVVDPVLPLALPPVLLPVVDQAQQAPAPAPLEVRLLGLEVRPQAAMLRHRQPVSRLSHPA